MRNTQKHLVWNLKGKHMRSEMILPKRITW